MNAVQKMNDLLKLAIDAAIKGGEEIMKVYASDFEVELKSDYSPLTEADKNAHEAIKELLMPSDLPLLSEEGKGVDHTERKNWGRFWMVDPLDGTKEFVKRNGEFTVNIALIEQGFPVMGVIYVPVLKTLYYGDLEHGAFKVEEVETTVTEDQLSLNAKPMPLPQGERNYTLVGSRSHPSAETAEYIKSVEARKGQVDIVSRGSSLKLCMVAEGVADEYPRFAPTMEWDTAAGQAIVEASGKKVIGWSDKKRLPYNKENLLNDWFLVGA